MGPKWELGGGYGGVLPARKDKGRPSVGRATPAHYLVSNVRHSSLDFCFACWNSD